MNWCKKLKPIFKIPKTAKVFLLGFTSHNKGTAKCAFAMHYQFAKFYVLVDSFKNCFFILFGNQLVEYKLCYFQVFSNSIFGFLLIATQNSLVNYNFYTQSSYYDF